MAISSGSAKPSGGRGTTVPTLELQRVREFYPSHETGRNERTLCNLKTLFDGQTYSGSAAAAFKETEPFEFLAGKAK